METLIMVVTVLIAAFGIILLLNYFMPTAQRNTVIKDMKIKYADECLIIHSFTIDVIKICLNERGFVRQHGCGWSATNKEIRAAILEDIAERSKTNRPTYLMYGEWYLASFMFGDKECSFTKKTASKTN